MTSGIVCCVRFARKTVPLVDFRHKREHSQTSIQRDRGGLAIMLSWALSVLVSLKLCHVLSLQIFNPCVVAQFLGRKDFDILYME